MIAVIMFTRLPHTRGPTPCDKYLGLLGGIVLLDTFAAQGALSDTSMRSARPQCQDIVVKHEILAIIDLNFSLSFTSNNSPRF